MNKNPSITRGNQFYEQIPELVASAKKGDEQALSGLCQFAYKRIYPYVFYRVKHREDAEDVTAEVVLKMARSLKNQQGNFMAWL